MKNRFPILIFSIIFLISFTLASFPGIPHQFYGNVLVDGNLATSGTITAEIRGETIKTYEFSTGEYGYDPVFFIEDSGYSFNGKLITFYINDVEAGQYIFENGGITKLDLNCSGCSIIPEDDGNGIDGGKIRSKLQQFCDVNWKCSGWSECVDGATTRTCQDTNHCDFSYNKPNEIAGCEEEIISKSLVDKKDFNMPLVLSIIITIILLLVLLALIRKT